MEVLEITYSALLLFCGASKFEEEMSALFYQCFGLASDICSPRYFSPASIHAILLHPFNLTDRLKPWNHVSQFLHSVSRNLTLIIWKPISPSLTQTFFGVLNSQSLQLTPITLSNFHDQLYRDNGRSAHTRSDTSTHSYHRLRCHITLIQTHVIST